MTGSRQGVFFSRGAGSRDRRREDAESEAQFLASLRDAMVRDREGLRQKIRRMRPDRFDCIVGRWADDAMEFHGYDRWNKRVAQRGWLLARGPLFTEGRVLAFVAQRNRLHERVAEIDREIGTVEQQIRDTMRYRNR